MPLHPRAEGALKGAGYDHERPAKGMWTPGGISDKTHCGALMAPPGARIEILTSESPIEER